jgi:hypothetical protein
MGWRDHPIQIKGNMMSKGKFSLVVPIIHSNGSGKRNLRTQAADVYRDIEAALETMRRARPHGRDFYIGGPDDPSLADAQEAFEDCEAALVDVREAFLAYARAIQRR